MVRLEVGRGDPIHVDRDGRGHDHGREGFVLGIAGAKIEFEDEADAAALARRILLRLGELEAKPAPLPASEQVMTHEQRAADVCKLLSDKNAFGDLTTAGEKGTLACIAAAICQAVEAERERCAAIADDCYAMLCGHANHDYGHNAEQLALDISRAIRGGK